MIDARHLGLIIGVTPYRFLGVCDGPHFNGRDYLCGFGPV
jgi:hypothetical protein